MSKSAPFEKLEKLSHTILLCRITDYGEALLKLHESFMCIEHIIKQNAMVSVSTAEQLLNQFNMIKGTYQNLIGLE